MALQLFFTVYFLILVAELPDKTALATVLLATREKPLPIFVGAAAAFVVQTAVAVFFGKFLGMLPAKYVHLGAAVLFFVFAFLAWRRPQSDRAAEPGASAERNFWQTTWIAFMVIFLAEWGDLTQLATATLVAKYNAPLLVFVASVLGLWSATGLAIFAGRWAKSYVSPKILNRSAAILFLAMGIYLIFV